MNEIRKIDNLRSAIMGGVTLENAEKTVTVRLITNKTFTEEDRARAYRTVKNYVPAYFKSRIVISKLTPDCEMIKRAVMQALEDCCKSVASTVTEEDVSVTSTSDGFEYTVKTFTSGGEAVCGRINSYLKGKFCGEFDGKFVEGEKSADDISVEETEENVEFEIPVRKFNVANFMPIDSSETVHSVVYISDLNFESEKVSVCGVINDIRERTYNRGGQEKTYYNYTVADQTASMRVTYFPKLKTIERVRRIKTGDSVVFTGKSESYNGFLRFTANKIDLGSAPEGFIPEKRPSKPVPAHYSYVKPQPYSDISQGDMFADSSVPQCLNGKSFVVFDLETTGLNSTPSTGNMDRIIEIGAYKIRDGLICESFSTFINPEKKLSEEIVKLTGIDDSMVADAPEYEKVMPDFFKFCDGCILVGHNIAGFDFKFVEYYCARLGYVLERRIIDTIPLAQEQLFLSNYKLNTVADKFGITFNHHRASDDALVTAKIFIELIKLKKSLPDMQ